MKEVLNMRSLLMGTGVGLVLGAAAVGLSSLAWPQEVNSSNPDPRAVTYQQLVMFA